MAGIAGVFWGFTLSLPLSLSLSPSLSLSIRLLASPRNVSHINALRIFFCLLVSVLWFLKPRDHHCLA
ncbi:hypothetical protein LZ30DRAFT_726651 [Colletotrichum cereale]|nr:hypothetical protein LZ30DRAFT_726651 [Colletotrichum cereale]